MTDNLDERFDHICELLPAYATDSRGHQNRFSFFYSI